jgi:hypothetical protein
MHSSPPQGDCIGAPSYASETVGTSFCAEYRSPSETDPTSLDVTTMTRLANIKDSNRQKRKVMALGGLLLFFSFLIPP